MDAGDVTISVSRADSYRDGGRAYRVLIDGTEAIRLRRGQTATVFVPAGAHVLQARIDWTGSPELRVDLLPGDAATFVCRGLVSPLTAFTEVIRSLWNRHAWLALERTS